MFDPLDLVVVIDVVGSFSINQDKSIICGYIGKVAGEIQQINSYLRFSFNKLHKFFYTAETLFMYYGFNEVVGPEPVVSKSA